MRLAARSDVLAGRGAAEEQHDRLAGADRLRHGRDGLVLDRGCGPGSASGASGAAPSPQETSAGRISVATWPGARRAATTASAASPATSSGSLRAADPAGDVPGQRVDVGLERRVVLVVVGRMVADEVDDRDVRATRVVQVRDAVAEPGPEVEQRARGLVGHACVAVGRAGDDALEEAEHRAHPRDVVERGDEVHLGGARVREADLDVGVDERLDQGVGAVHAGSPESKMVPGLRMPFGSNAVLMRRMRSTFTGSSSAR